MDETLTKLANDYLAELPDVIQDDQMELIQLLMRVRDEGRQEGFAEAREMAAELAKYRNCQKCWTTQTSFAEAIRALQPPRDEGKREGGDG